MRKLFILIALLVLIGVGTGFQWLSVVGSKTPAAGGTTVYTPIGTISSNAVCPTSGTTCSVTLNQTIGAGHLVVVWGSNYTVTASHITGLSAGAGTATLCPSSTCAGFDSSQIADDFAVILSASSFAGPMVITWSQAFTANNGVAEVREYSFTNGPVSIDGNGGTRDQSSGASSIAGVAMSPTGASDLIVQGIAGSDNCSAITTYTHSDFLSGNGIADLLNTTSGTAPTWTCAANTFAALNAVAIK